MKNKEKIDKAIRLLQSIEETDETEDNLNYVQLSIQFPNLQNELLRDYYKLYCQAPDKFVYYLNTLSIDDLHKLINYVLIYNYGKASTPYFITFIFNNYRPFLKIDKK